MSRGAVLCAWLLLLLSVGLPLRSAQAQGQLINGSRVLAGTLNFCIDTNADVNVNTLVCNLNPAISTYRTGMRYTVKAGSTNLAPVTLNLNGLGAKTIKKVQGGITTDLAANDIHLGQIIDVIYDGVNMQMLSQLGNAPSGTAGVIDAASYGVICDGTTDTTTALQTAVTAAKSGTAGKRLAMPAGGTCKLSSAILVTDVTGFVLDGNGVIFIWAGNTSTPMFLCRDCRKSKFHGFQILTSTQDFLLLAAFQFENGSGTTVTPTENVVEDVYIECTNGGCINGIRMAQGSGGDANSDFNKFIRVSVNNYANAAAKIEHSQSKHNLFEDFACYGNGFGVHCIDVINGSFECVRCYGGTHTGATFYVATSFDQNLITGSNFENDARLLETGGPSGGPLLMTIESTRWVNNFLHADKKAIIYQFAGPLILQNNFFEIVTENEPMEFYFNPIGGLGSVIAIGNYIASTLANPYTGIQPKLSVGNRIDRNDGAGSVDLDAVMRFGQVTFSALGSAPYTTSTNGSMLFCSDCTLTNPCAGSGTGAFAKRQNSQWNCS